jgi:hypothetical protein
MFPPPASNDQWLTVLLVAVVILILLGEVCATINQCSDEPECKKPITGIDEFCARTTSGELHRADRPHGFRFICLRDGKRVRVFAWGGQLPASARLCGHSWLYRP